VFFYAIDGSLAHSREVVVPAMSQFDLILNELPEFVDDSYGIIKLEFEGIIDGRVSYYRSSLDATDYEFAFSIPLSNATLGSSSVGFNTFQPSLQAAESSNVVANWLTIVNLAASPKQFVVQSFNQDGSSITSRSVSVSAFGRIDIDGGHGLVGPSVVGLHRIIPNDPTAPYISQLIRYGGNTDMTQIPSAYSFAFPLVARAGTGRTLIAPISAQFNESNWIEIINTSNEEVSARIEFLDSNGIVLDSSQNALAPNAQIHFHASDRLADGETGTVVIRSSVTGSLIAQSMYYFRDAEHGNIVGMYGAQANEALGRAIFGSYNLFLGMQNWLTIGNNATSVSQVQLIVNTATGVSETTFELPARGSQVVPLHDYIRFGTAPDSYGTVELRASQGANVYGQILRLRPNGQSYDFATPTLVR
jgi:hypothetical protein